MHAIIARDVKPETDDQYRRVSSSVVNIPNDCTKVRVAKPHDAPHIRVYRTDHAASWAKIARPERFYCYNAHNFLNYNTNHCGHTGTFILYPPNLISFLYSPHYSFSGLPKLEIKKKMLIVLSSQGQ
jgi:hypothetical protein